MFDLFEVYSDVSSIAGQATSLTHQSELENTYLAPIPECLRILISSLNKPTTLINSSEHLARRF